MKRTSASEMHFTELFAMQHTYKDKFAFYISSDKQLISLDVQLDELTVFEEETQLLRYAGLVFSSHKRYCHCA